MRTPRRKPISFADTALTRTEATNLFFSVTKLFVSSDASLRRLVYLFIKEVRPLCDPSDVIMVTSCLTKDITCDIGLYRANAIRVLVNIIDSAMLGNIERYMKQAIVDNDPVVSNSALVAASHLFDQSVENAAIVRRWIGEVQETLLKQCGAYAIEAAPFQEANEMVQMNAMRLLCQMKRHDRLGVAKLVQQFTGPAGKGLRGPMTLIILLRACGRLLSEELLQAGNGRVREISPLCRQGFEFLEASLSHACHVVSFEAARTICALPHLQLHDLTSSIQCLRRMLSSELPSVRFAAVRLLSLVANDHPTAVARCNEGLENAIEDPNKNVATMALTTLLITGNEQSIDRLLGSITHLFLGVPDEFKIAVLKTLHKVCLQYPNKHQMLVAFMASFLREEGGFDFKHCIINVIVSLMRLAPETTETSLFHLCEFIDDCEYSMLSTQAIHILAELGPQTTMPSMYTRFLYNRVVLENATVRAAAVSALTKFAANCPSLRSSIMPLLRQSRWDDDDEVRDRAAIAVAMLKNAMEAKPYVSPEINEYEENIPLESPAEGDLAAFLFLEPLPMTFHNLEESIKTYIATPGAMSDTEPLTLSTLPIIEDSADSATENDDDDIKYATDGFSRLDLQLGSNAFRRVSSPNKRREDPAAAVYAIPELAQFGRIFRSSIPIPLTEEETEYVVKCVKHILLDHVILQFIIQNTVEDQCMKNIIIEIVCDSTLYEIVGDVPAENLKYGATTNCFTVLSRNVDEPIVPVNFSCQLNFLAVQTDYASDEALNHGYQEEYPLEELVLAPSDFMAKVSVVDFRKAWNETNDNDECLDKFLLQFKRLGDAVSAVINFLGMTPCDGTDNLPKTSLGGIQHMLHLSGRFVGGKDVLARAQLTLQSDGTLLKIAVRSSDEATSKAVMSCIK